ncbi:sulfite exporter TauE/SafE family protein [Marivivens aquimaris]|uniref:sulfite exporter TauE/SafE family protein n=1 Tax=Marivivens aquimaris TaxID=2774876 RepID=UPI001882DC4E|nr:sulfite exporter TauE/SafE family protein [Marivivens aquimaris]
MDGTAFWIVSVIAAISVGLSKGGLAALGTIAVPVMALAIDPIVAAGLLLPVFVVSDIFGVWTYRKHFDKQLLIISIIGGTVGVVIGGLLASVVSEHVVTLFVGLIGVLFTLNFILKRGAEVEAEPLNKPKGYFWTAIAGFTSFVSHSGGPPYQMFVLPLKLPKMVFAGTITLAFAYINAIKLIPYAMLGQINLHSLGVSAILMVPAVISVFVGVRLVKILPDKIFYNFVIIALGIVSLKLVFDAITAMI